MGIYRLLLSFLVAYSHIGPSLSGNINVGVSSVVSFFLLSGFVMTALINKYYLDSKIIYKFYIERIMRLFPQFLFYSILTYVFASLLNLRHNWLQALPSPGSAFLQMLMLPLNFHHSFPNMLLPQAWSLGLELIFYMVIPIIIYKRAEFTVFFISIFVFLLAYFKIINNDLWAYRLLPGNIFIFLLGSYIYRFNNRRGAILVAAVFSISLFFLFLTWTFPYLATEVNRSMAVGLAVGGAVVFLLKSKSAEVHNSKWMPSAGDISYGVFLNHNFVVGILAILNFTNNGGNNISYIISVFFISTILSYVTFILIEGPISRKRRKMRDQMARDTLQSDPG